MAARRMKRTIATSLPEEELAELDRVREQQSLTRSQALRQAVRWCVGAMRRLPLPESRCRMRSKPCTKPKQSSLAAADGYCAPCCMTWNVVLSNRAERALVRLPARDRQRITRALLSVEQEPLSGDVIPLKGPFERSYRRRVGSWRIIFVLKWDTQVVFVADVAWRTSTTY
jgi:mRNA-degrading endonuclease RelE of RelBE toxin-antitoxin system